jgi:hypothetical protein
MDILLLDENLAIDETTHAPNASKDSYCLYANCTSGGTSGFMSDAPHAPNLSAARALALAASSSRFFGGALVSSERMRRLEAPAISSIAARNAASFAFDGLLKPLIFRTNWSDADRISSPVTGGSKLKSVLMFLHISSNTSN